MVRHLLDAAHWTYRSARRLVVLLVGTSVIVVGLAMIVLPGPAILVIPLGLAILGIEFAWARRWLHAVRAQAGQVVRHDYRGWLRRGSAWLRGGGEGGPLA